MAKLFYDDEFEAQAQTIANSERPFKEVAAFLFPHLKPESQYARLKNCLNPKTDERLTFGQIIAMCRFCACFDALYYMADELSHDRPAFHSPDDEKAQLMREFIETGRRLQKIQDRIERVTGQG